MWKKITGALLLFGLLTVNVSAEGEEQLSYPYTKTFKISAYYSPLPCQDRYVTGSFEGDKRLNGNGTNGADGTPVYPGMVAAPKTYAFGTKMAIPGIGNVAVHDRGGAIVASNGQEGVYDRLDIWMGYGDVGLKRALNWGKRNVDVTVYGNDPSVSEQITLLGFTPEEKNYDPAKCEKEEVISEKVEVAKAEPEIVLASAKKKEAAAPIAEDGLFYNGLSAGSAGADVARLQNELRGLNLFKAGSTGFYGEVTAHAVFKFQQSVGLVATKEDQGAGVFGPATRKALNQIIKERRENLVRVADATQRYYGKGGSVMVAGF